MHDAADRPTPPLMSWSREIVQHNAQGTMLYSQLDGR